MAYSNHYFTRNYFPSYFQTVQKTERLDRWVACGWVAPGWIAGRPCAKPAEQPTGSHGPDFPGFYKATTRMRPRPVYLSASSAGHSRTSVALVLKQFTAAASAGASNTSCRIISDTSAARRKNQQAAAALSRLLLS